MIFPYLPKLAIVALLLINLTSTSIALPLNAASKSSNLLQSKRFDGDSNTSMDDADQTIPPPTSGPSYADWMKHLYDMGGKVRRTTPSFVEQRDNMDQYKSSITQEEIDAWRLAREGRRGD